MKILEHGNPELVQQPLEFHCEACGCRFIADYTEYKRIRKITDDLDYDTCETVCPECGTLIDRAHFVNRS